MADVEIVLVNNTRVTLRVGDVFLKIDSDDARARREADALKLAPVPTPEVLWHRAPVLALAGVGGSTLGRLGESPTAPPSAWAAVGRVVRALHDAPLPPWPATPLAEITEQLDRECRWLEGNGALPPGVLRACRSLAELALQPRDSVFIHGDLHLEHVFVDGDEVTGIIDWSEARAGDPHLDIACLTLANEDRLPDVLEGYGPGVDPEVVRSWWACRCLLIVRWLVENGYGSPDQLPEVEVLRSLG